MSNTAKYVTEKGQGLYRGESMRDLGKRRRHGLGG